MIEIPEEIAKKAYDVSMFFKRQGHDCWAYHDLCSRSFVEAEAAKLTNKYKNAFIIEQQLQNKYHSKLQRIWKELDPMFNTEDKW